MIHNDMNTLQEHLLACCPVIVVAMFGALLQTIRGKWPGWRNFLYSELAAGFGAFIAGELFHALNLPYGIIVFVAGMIGWSGGELVDLFLSATKEKIVHDGDAEDGEKR